MSSTNPISVAPCAGLPLMSVSLGNSSRRAPNGLSLKVGSYVCSNGADRRKPVTRVHSPPINLTEAASSCAVHQRDLLGLGPYPSYQLSRVDEPHAAIFEVKREAGEHAGGHTEFRGGHGVKAPEVQRERCAVGTEALDLHVGRRGPGVRELFTRLAASEMSIRLGSRSRSSRSRTKSTVDGVSSLTSSWSKVALSSHGARRIRRRAVNGDRPAAKLLRHFRSAPPRAGRAPAPAPTTGDCGPVTSVCQQVAHVRTKSRRWRQSCRVATNRATVAAKIGSSSSTTSSRGSKTRCGSGTSTRTASRPVDVEIERRERRAGGERGVEVFGRDRHGFDGKRRREKVAHRGAIGRLSARWREHAWLLRS